MKRAVNVRLEESVIVTLNQLTKELHVTKTEVIEKAISLFFKQNKRQQSQLLQFAGKLKASDADAMIESIQKDKNVKDFELSL